MARQRSASFQGATPQQCDPGSYTYRTVIRDAVGDAALVHDVLTGDNGPTFTVDHDGDGHGAPLGVPLGQVAVRLDGDNRPKLYPDAGYQSVYAFAVPFVLPRGETTVTVEATIDDPDGVVFEVRDTSWALAGETREEAPAPRIWRGTSSSLTAGTRYFALVKCEIGPVEPSRAWSGFRLYFPRLNEGPILMPPETSLGGVAYPLDTTTDGAGDTVPDVADWDSTVFNTDGRALHAQIPVRLNRKQHTVAEYLTATPAGGNSALTLTAFHDHSGNTYTNEAAIDLPLVTAPLGAVLSSSSGPDYATTRWGAPSPNTASKTVVLEDPVYMPDFAASGVDTSRLRLIVLFSCPDATSVGTTNPTISALTRTTAGGSLTERSAGASWCGTSNFGYVELGATSGTGNRIAFAPGEVNALQWSVTDTKYGSGRTVRLCGYTWFFDGA